MFHIFMGIALVTDKVRPGAIPYFGPAANCAVDCSTGVTVSYCGCMIFTLVLLMYLLSFEWSNVE
jgi:hypothetical protein